MSRTLWRKRCAMLVAALSSGATIGSARAEEPAVAEKPVEHTARWVVEDNGAKVGVETLSSVVSPTRTRFASGAFKSASKGVVAVLYHLQRNPDGKVLKYRRVKDERKGEGVFAFQRGDGMRVVGINSKRKQTDVDGSARYLVWDAQLWAPLWDWLPAFERGGAEVELAYLDIERMVTAKATAKRQEPRAVVGPKAEPVSVTGWQVQGLGAGKPLTLWIDGEGRLVGVERGPRRMILAEWAWEAAPPVPDPNLPAKPADPAAPGTGQPRDEEGGPDVGP